ncbi:HTR-like protein [Halobacteriales archaeon QS_1_68_20]|nr:MAG: HTR-like protein [Halobacteriales archaeon QS_1_68_20]
MALTEDKVRSLVEGDEGMAESLSAVYRAADSGPVEWADVREEVSSGHWGRLIETGVLVDGGDGFRLENPDTVEQVLRDVDAGDLEPADEDDEIESSGWSTYDKLAGLASLGLFAAYSVQSLRAVIGGTVDVFLGPLDAVLPFHVVVLLVAVLTGLVSALVQSSLINTEKMQQYQERMKEFQERRKRAKERGDEEEMKRIQQEQMDAMSDQAGMLKEQFRPTVWIMLFTIPMFLWIYWRALDPGPSGVPPAITAPMLGETGWRQGVLGPMQLWIVWYFLCSMAFTNILRKSLDLSVMPTS